MSKPILALNSIRGKSGKDTLIEHIGASGLKVHRVAFGDSLKEECAATLAAGYGHATTILLRWMHGPEKDTPYPGLSVDLLPDTTYSRWLRAETLHDRKAPRSVRWHLQLFGNEFTRTYLGKPHHWLDQGSLEVLKGQSDPSVDVVVVTDMRQANEYERMSLAGAHLIRIVRNWHVPEVDTVPYHESDIALLAHAFDALVVNEWGRPEDMFKQIERFL